MSEYKSGKPWSEGREQCELVSWVKRTYGPELAECLHHSANGEERHKAVAALLKLMGVRRGFPDLVLYHPRGKFTGLVIELKPTRRKGKRAGVVKPKQKEWLERLRGCGFDCYPAWGWVEASEIITEYMALTERVENG